MPTGQPTLADLTDRLVASCESLHFAPPVTHVYNPLVYARAVWDQYCARYGQGRRDVLVCGLNPGPYGMAQVGVPFGEVHLVREFLGLDAPVGKPAIEHPRVPVQGFGCHRSEVSGARFWGWVKSRYGSPAAFFQQAFVANYCPLSFMEGSGRNRTPDKLPAAEREPLFRACDEALAGLVAHFRPKVVVGVGHFAQTRLQAIVRSGGRSEGRSGGRSGGRPEGRSGGGSEGRPGGRPGDAILVGRVPHPSPASPAANHDWAGQMDRAWAALGLSVQTEPLRRAPLAGEPR